MLDAQDNPFNNAVKIAQAYEMEVYVQNHGGPDAVVVWFGPQKCILLNDKLSGVEKAVALMDKLGHTMLKEMT